MREKKLENSSECYNLGLPKTLINSILLSSPTKSLTQQNQNSLKLFCSNLAISRELLKSAVILQKEVSNIPVILSKLQNSEKSNALLLSKICGNVLLLFKLAYKWVLKRKESF